MGLKRWKLIAILVSSLSSLLSLSAGKTGRANFEPYSSLPLSFEPNEGQSDPTVKFVSHGAGYTVSLTGNEAIITLAVPDEADRVLAKMDQHVRKRFEARRFYRLSPRFHHNQKSQAIRVTMEGSNGSARLVPIDHLPGTSNYFIGRDPKKWRTGIPTYGKIKCEAVYPGTDLIYYGRRGQLEFDFVLSPGANPSAIRFHVDAPATITKDGALSVATAAGPLELLRPTIFQMQDGKRVPVQGQFVLRGDDTSVGIQVAEYDHTAQLIIDPVLSYSTYVGGNGSDYNSGVVVDSQGNAYIAGQTTSTNFPTSNGYSATGNSNGVAFVTKMNPNGTAILYSTYLGGSGGDWAAGIALDPSRNVYVTGSTLSADFPTVNPVQANLLSPNGNAFVARIDTTQSGAASLVYSTYLGGGGNSSNSLADVGLGIAADASGLAYITGQTASDSSFAPFPTTYTALQSSIASVNGNAFLTVLDTTGGGPQSLIYSTYLGGASTGFGDYGVGIAVDSSRDAFVTGQTTSGASGPFPTTSTAYQASLNSQNGNVFVTEIATTQSGSGSLVYSSYLGGSSTIVVGDMASSIGVDAAGKIYVGGDTTSSDFPVTSGAYQTTNSAAGKAFVAAFNPTVAGSQSLIYSTFLGGTNGGEGEVINALTVAGNSNVFVAGSSSSSDFPATSGAFQTVLKNQSWDAFLSELNPAGTNLLYSTYFGGSCANGDLGNGVALDWIGNPYLAGSTCSTDLSVYPANVYQTSLGGTYNAFVAKFALNTNPGITAAALPLPNASGWNNSPVTVSFLCIPGGAPIQSCPSQVAVSSEGANQVISGTVIDTGNDSSTASDSVNLDLTPPVISIASPSNGATVSSNSLTVIGTATDALSGVSGVTCNGTQATISGSNFWCSLILSSMSNSISVTGTDLAGNTASITITVSLAIPGGSASTGNLNIARQSHTATLLTSGLVLMAGGTGTSGVGSTAELYNPAMGAFTLTGNLNASHYNHTATLLNDGTVLITGGYDQDFVPQNTAEIYSPSSGTFMTISGMSTARASHTATLLNDGTVLIVGGFDANYNALASAELYDPATATFTGLGTLITGRVLHTAILLSNGKVLVAGGQDSNSNALSAAELYDPSSRNFSATGNLNTARDLHTATLLNNGMVLIAGGQDSNFNALGSAELFNPSSGTFTATGNMTAARLRDTATLLGNGNVLIAGGTDNLTDFFSSTELYDPVGQVFSASGAMSTARASQSATVLGNGTVLLAGGYEVIFVDPTFANAEVYQPTTATPPNLASIILSPSTPSASAGATQRFTATGTFADNSTQILSSVTWISNNNAAASLTNDASNRGAAFGIAAGSATVNACTGSICGSTTLTVSAAQLNVTGLSPAAGSIGAQVIIAGTGFGSSQGTSTVSLNGTTATASVWSPTGIVVTVPSGATSGNVVVNVGGVNSNSVPFIVSSGPVITGLAPPAGFAGTAVVINGANFGISQGNGTVTLNGLAAAVTSWNSTAIGITVPNGATTGNVVVTVSGMASNGAIFTVPAITEMTPSSGPVGTLVTIGGSGFGATQGSGSVSISGTPMQVMSWSDGLILAGVATGTTTGAVDVQEGAVVIPGPTFTISSAFPYSVLSQISLLVGQSTTVPVTDSNGNTVTGLRWKTTNPNVVSLSTDNPPLLTGVAPGSATVYAGVVPIAVTVNAGSTLSPGTPVWSLPISVSTPADIAPAVPSSTGVDVFAMDGNGMLSAISSDGTTVWRTGPFQWTVNQTSGDTTTTLLRGSIIPDFTGNAVLKNVTSFFDGQNMLHAAHVVTTLDPNTHQPTVLYTFASNGSQGTLLWDGFSTEAVIPDTTGVLFVQDNTNFMLFNLSTGAQIATATLRQGQCNAPGGQAACQPFSPGPMIVAGDGNAYATYLYEDSSGPAGFTGTFQSTRHWMLLRFSPDGSYANIELRTPTTETENCAIADPNAQPTPTVQCTSNDPILIVNQSYVITNADQGVVAFGNAIYDGCSFDLFHEFGDGIQLSGCPTNDQLATQVQVSYVSKDSLTSNVPNALVFPYPTDITGFQPQLQLSDGSVIGTEQAYTDGGLGAPQNNLIALNSSGNQEWSTVINTSANLNPPPPLGRLYATSDGSTTEIVALSNGSSYTVDQNGNLLAQGTDDGGRYSWSGEWYAAVGGGLSDLSENAIAPPTSYLAFTGGNPSGNQTSVGVTESIEGLPIFAVPSWGISCKLATEGSGNKVPLGGAALDQYNLLKGLLLAGNFLTCPACSAFFNADPTRAGYFSQLTTAVANQVPYDGLQTNISDYDAGMLTTADMNNPAKVNILKGAPVCGHFINYQGAHGSVTVTGKATAAAQLRAPDGGVGTDVYINTKDLKHLTQATILHEALHNLTGLYDTELELLLGLNPPTDCPSGSVCISAKLLANGCTGN